MYYKLRFEFEDGDMICYADDASRVINIINIWGAANLMHLETVSLSDEVMRLRSHVIAY